MSPAAARAPVWRADQGDGRYRNPVLAADFSDPDVVRVGDDFYLVASSFNRAPGLPLLHSRDLVNWSFLGHALPRLPPEAHYSTPRRGCGVWAPALRWHDGRFRLYYGDPDHGVFVLTAADPRGPWTQPHLVKGGYGVIDPCPLWDGDDAYLVHAWARSRSGVHNRLTLHRMSADGTRLLDEGRVLVDGDLIPGCHTLEGPKLYRHGGWYWIFAPAGGVADGWQSVLRSRTVDGPYEHRIVLARNRGPVNGPHQGAWVSDTAGGDWFLHFQDRGRFGRVVHLQPMTWRPDGWPVIGADPGGTGCGTPVPEHTVPAGPRGPAAGPAADDDFTSTELGPQWTWQANPGAGWYTVGGGRLRLTALPGPGDGDLRLAPNVLGQRLPAVPCTVSTRLFPAGLAPGGSAGLMVLGDAYAWIGVRRKHVGPHGCFLVRRSGPAPAGATPLPDRSVPLPDPDGPVDLEVSVDARGLCRFRFGSGGRTRPIGPPHPATAGRWVGATLGLFAVTAPETVRAAPGGFAEFGAFRVRAGG
ncbi:glycoside hydrolase 43 family protein [Marinactinospora rubrisoli]|uniref:Glycoside hydrolase 43 family protein n=1 Tax=Marinactinospora rubrisoli TaxID=2715399 RepID=A0ABW2KMM0_9ACTN